MVGLLDYLANGAIGGVQRGLLSGLEAYGPAILDYYRNQTAPQGTADPLATPVEPFGIPSPAPPRPYPMAEDPMKAGGAAPQTPPGALPQIPPPAPAARGPSLPNPIAIGNYQMPRLGNADLFDPQQVNLPQNAQPAQAQIQPQQSLPPAFGRNPAGFFDRINQGLQSLGNGGSLIGAATGTYTDPQSIAQQNLKAQYESLVPILGPQKAMLAVLNPEAGKALFKGEFENPKTVEGVIAQRMADQKGGAKGGVDAGLSDYAKFLQTKNSAEKAGATLGEQQATAQLNLPSAVAQSKEALAVADRLLSHKGREGNPFFHSKASSYIGDALIPGNTQAYDANSLLSQLKGGAFLNAYATLRGGGQISNTEGAKAEQAILRANRAQSREEFDQAIRDFKSSLQLAIDNANFRAGNAPPYGFQGSQLGVGDTTTINGVTVRRVK